MRYIFLLYLALNFLSYANAVKEADPTSEQKKTSEEIYILSGNYQLISLNGQDVSSEEILLKVDDKAKYLVINTGCNALRVGFLQKKEKVNFQSPESTKMYCEGKMLNEDKLYTIFPKISEIEKSAGDLLYLKNGKDILLTIQKTENSE